MTYICSLLWVEFKLSCKGGTQLELAVFSSWALSAAPPVSSVDASLVEAAVFGLSCGVSEGSTTVLPRLVLQPMIWQNLLGARLSWWSPEVLQYRALKSRNSLNTCRNVLGSGAFGLYGNLETSCWVRPPDVTLISVYEPLSAGFWWLSPKQRWLRINSSNVPLHSYW